MTQLHKLSHKLEEKHDMFKVVSKLLLSLEGSTLANGTFRHPIEFDMREG